MCGLLAFTSQLVQMVVDVLAAQAQGVGDFFGLQAIREEAGDGVALELTFGQLAGFAEFMRVVLDGLFGDVHQSCDLILGMAGADVG